MLETFDKLGIPLSEQKRLSNVAVDAVFDSVSIATTYKEKLAEHGVVFCSITDAVNEYPELVRRYLGTVVPSNDNYFAALNSAVFSDGSFVFIPRGVECPMELSSYFRINSGDIGQFERTLISANSRYDKYLRQELQLTPSELNGYVIFNSETGDCFHCHGAPFFTDFMSHNNGLDSVFLDLGLGYLTEDSLDYGKFKTPTLRNIVYTAPYMHDGRYLTLEEVIEHYNIGGIPSYTIDPLMKQVGVGLLLTESEKEDLLMFLLTLTDDEFLSNPDFSSTTN